MISFQPTNDEIAFVEVARDFAKERIRKQARQSENQLKVNDDLVEEAMQLGFLSLELPEEWNGLELPLLTQVQLLKTLSQGDLGIVQGITGAGDAASVFRLLPDHVGLQSIKERFIREANYPIALVDLTEGEEPFHKAISVRKNGKHYVINGETDPVRLAQFAEAVVVFTKDHDGESVVLLLGDQEWGVPNGDYRLGLLASGLGKLQFNNVTVRNILAIGEEAESLIQRVQTRNYILQAAKQNGLMEAALDYATQYTAERKAFGQEIAKFQGVSFKIAKMVMETRIVNHLTWEAASKADENSPEAYGLALRALHRAHKGVRFVTDAAVQLLGGHGFIQEFPVEKWMRDAQAQVALYGRERDLLIKRGATLWKDEGGVTVE